MQIKIKISYHFTPTRMATIKKNKKQKNPLVTSASKDLEKLEASHVASANVK